MVLTVGNTYTIELDGATATNGYNQLESFISLPNTIFQVQAVNSTYSVSSLGSPISKLYADACGWDPNPLSPTYRSCIVSDGKAGGTVSTTYHVKIISGGGTNQTLTTLLYDFSGSSFHYNSDFSTSARIASIIDPAQVTIAKAFSPSSTVAGGSSTLSIALSNPTSAIISGVSFSDNLPTSPGSMVVAASPNAATAGCGSPTFSPVAGASSISFANGTIAPNSTCSISVRVSVAASPASGTYTNTTNDVFVNSIDTGHTATANLTLTPATAGTGVCGITLAKWTYPTGDTSLAPSTQASDVLTATGSAGNSLTSSLDTSDGNPLGSLQTNGWPRNGPVVTSTFPFYQFALDTSKYTQVQMQFDMSIAKNGPDSMYVYYSTNGTSWTQENVSAIAATSVFTTFGPFDFTGKTAASTTYFRLYGFGALNTGNDTVLNLDNVAFSGCGTAQPLTVSKAFQTNPIALNGVSQLSFLITNTNSVTVTGVQFTDALPSGLQVATTPGASTTGCGTPTFTPRAGSTSLTFTGGSLAANSSCTVAVNVTGTTTGPHVNVSGFISSTETGLNSRAGGSASASLTVLQAPVITKYFAPNPILANGTAHLTFTILNPNPSDSLPAVAFTDTLPVSPGAMLVAGTPNASTTGCGAPTFLPPAGAGTISFSNGTIAAGGSCVVSVDVTASATGAYTNTSGLVSSTIAGVTVSGNSASDTLHVNAPHPGIALAKQVSTNAAGPWTDFVVAAPGSSIYYRLTIENTGDVPLSPVTVSDPNLSLAGCSWPGTLPVASPTQDPTAVCTLGPIAAQLGDFQNTATTQGTYSGTAYTSTSTAEYVGANPGLGLVKQIGLSASGPWSASLTGVPAGSSLFYKFIAINNGGLTLTTLSLVDPLIDTSSCTLIDPLAASQATDCAVGPITASSMIGVYTNTAVISGTNAGTTYPSAPASASYTLISPDLVVTKTNNTGGSITIGSGFTWTLAAGNSGTAAATFADGQTLLTETLPSNAVYTNLTVSDFSNVTNAANVACDIASDLLSCTATGGSVIIGAGGSFDVAYGVTPTATGSLANTAAVDPDGHIIESNELNNTGADTVIVNAKTADLAITKSDGLTSLAPNQDVTYTVVITNNGPSAADSALLTDPAVAGLTINGLTCGAATNGAVCPSSGNTVADLQGAGIAIPTLPSGSSLTFSITGTVTASGGNLTNIAAITPPTGTTDSDGDNNGASDTDTVAIATDTPAPTETATPTETPTSTPTPTDTGTATETSTPTVTQTATPTETPTSTATETATPTSTETETLTPTTTETASPTETFTPTPAETDTPTQTPTSTLTQIATPTETSTAAPTQMAMPTPTNTGTASPQADLAISKTDGLTSVSPNQGVTYTVVVSNNGPSAADDARLTDPAVANLTVTGLTCGSPRSGAVCPSSGNTVADLQGEGIVIPSLPNGGSLTLSVAASVIANSGSLTNTAVVAPPPGTTDPASSNNIAHDTDNVNARIYKLFLPLISGAPIVNPTVQWSVGLGYEDLPLAGSQNDYDYNDWVVDISGTLSYSAGTPSLVKEMSLSFLPRARGAGYDHSFQIRIPAQLFPSDGTAVLTVYDQNHNVVSTQRLAFVGSAGQTFVIFPKTSVVFPGSTVNAVEGKALVAPQQFADLSITFDTPFIFNPNLRDFAMPHGTGLFFDPYLVVLNTADQIHVGDLRLLSVPTMSWLWPEEGVRLDHAYPSVLYIPGFPPQFSFPSSWWTNFNHCVYDGLRCGTP